MKTLHFGTSTYTSSARLSAVEVRAKKVLPDYEKKLRAADVKYCGTVDDGVTVGPMLSRLRSFGGVTALVFGCMGEANKDVHKLVKNLAAAAGRDFVRRTGQSTTTIATGLGMWHAKRLISMTALRARAHLLVSRLQFIGLNAKKSFNTAKRYRFFYRAPTDSPDFARNCENAARCSSNSRPPFRGG